MTAKTSLAPQDYIEGRIERIPFSGCWIWTGSMQKRGYGTMSYRGIDWQAHRFSFMAFNGEIPPGMLVCHRCDVQLCVRPDHLFLGSDLDNLLDSIQKGRRGKVPPSDVERLYSMLDSGRSQREVAQAFGVGRTAIDYWNRKRRAARTGVPNER